MINKDLEQMYEEIRDPQGSRNILFDEFLLVVKFFPVRMHFLDEIILTHRIKIR